MAIHKKGKRTLDIGGQQYFWVIKSDGLLGDRYLKIISSDKKFSLVYRINSGEIQSDTGWIAIKDPPFEAITPKFVRTLVEGTWEKDDTIFSAVCELPHSSYMGKYPWEFDTSKEFDLLELSGKCNKKEIGTVVASLCSSNLIEPSPSIEKIRDDLLQLDGWIVKGGIHIVEFPGPGCCCGLETWREWLTFIDTGNSPWWGHDIDGGVERIDDQTIKIWSSGHIEKELSAQAYTHALYRVEWDLKQFVPKLFHWFRLEADDKTAQQLTDRFAQELHIPLK